VRPALQLQRTSLHDAHPACWACGGYGCDFNSVVREKWQDEAELMRAQRAVRCCCCARVSASSSEANNEQEGATKQCAAVLPSGRPQCMRNSEDAEGFTFNTACFPSENSDGQTRSVLSVLEVTPAVGAKDQATPTQPLSRTTEAGAVREEHTQGTVVAMCINAAYTLIFHSIKLTNLQCIRLASFVVHSLRLWRVWVHTTDGMTISENFLPPQTYAHVLMSCHSAVNIIRAFRDFSPTQPCLLRHSGSNSAENEFSRADGNGKVASRKRGFSTKDFVATAGSHAALRSFEVGRDVALTMGADQHRRQEYQPRYLEDVSKANGVPVIKNANKKDYAADPQMKQTWAAGMADSHALFRFVGGLPADASMAAAPWTNEWKQTAAEKHFLEAARKAHREATQEAAEARIEEEQEEEEETAVEPQSSGGEPQGGAAEAPARDESELLHRACGGCGCSINSMARVKSCTAAGLVRSQRAVR
jgi:hypothetical protein